MQIIIVGCGNVGSALTRELSDEGHDITVIDKVYSKVEDLSNNYDVRGMAGNGASLAIQIEAGVEEADLLIAVTTSDELNLLCCLIAKKAGDCNTIARVRNPIYNKEISFIKEELGLSLVINPEHTAALEISRLIKFPSAIKVDSFAKGRVELLKCKIAKGSTICNKSLNQITTELKCDILVCVVERSDEIYIPGGNFVLQEKDIIHIVGQPKSANDFFRKINMSTNRIKDTMIIGGGETTYYLAKQLLPMGIEVKIIEKDRDRCDELCELLPQAVIIHGDGTDRALLEEEGINMAHSFVAWTNFDEENIMLTLFAKSISNAKAITKIHRIAYDEIIDSMDLGSVLYPQNITADYIIQYVRAMQNSIGSNVETMYQLVQNQVEALEFYVQDGSPLVGIPIKSLDLKENLLLCCINRKGTIITPSGQDMLMPGDTVVVVTTTTGFNDLNNILK